MFTLELIPADYGDCLWIEYGDADAPSRVLIDCGTTATAPRLKQRLASVPADQRKLDLFVLTHIDADHIGGAIPFFKDPEVDIDFHDLWFNGWKHLPAEMLGGKQAEIFSVLIGDRDYPWNSAVEGGAMMIPGDELPTFTLQGGMKLTLLSPNRNKLARLRKFWKKELDRHGLTPGKKADFRQFLAGTPTTSTDVDALASTPFKSDTTAPNGSSIAFLAEYGGKSVLLVGDAHPPLLVDSIQKLLNSRGEERLQLDAFKLSHHASKANVSNELVQLVDCPRYLVSTNGARFHHPSHEAVARVIHHGGEQPTVCFNYRSDDNEVWDGEALKERYEYRTLYPEAGAEGIQITL